MSTDNLQKLRAPFPAHQISKLPKPTKKQTEEVRNDYKKGIRCELCGAWHHPDVVHLDYVGHAALTDRLLDTDPLWTWEPLAYRDGLPAFDQNGGLWIKLTVCGHTRIGYGSATENENKDNGAYEKEVIGDALRNAAMRFGAALELWHKGDLHLPEPQKPQDNSWSMKQFQPTDEEAGKGFSHDGIYRIPSGTHKGRTIKAVYDIIGQQKLEDTVINFEDRIKQNKPYSGFTMEQMQKFVDEASSFINELEQSASDLNKFNG